MGRPVSDQLDAIRARLVARWPWRRIRLELGVGQSTIARVAAELKNPVKGNSDVHVDVDAIGSGEPVHPAVREG